MAWDGERVMNIRDFRYARYATEGTAVKGQQCCPGMIARDGRPSDTTAGLGLLPTGFDLAKRTALPLERRRSHTGKLRPRLCRALRDHAEGECDADAP